MRRLDSLYRRVCGPLDIQSLPDDQLGSYVADAERVAVDVVSAAGIDVAALFDRVSDDTGIHAPFYTMDRSTLSPEVNRALDILEHGRMLRECIDSGTKRDVAAIAIRLAQHVERFNGDRAHLKLVNAGVGTASGGRKGAAVVHGQPGSKAAKYQAEYRARRRLHPDETKTDARKAVASKCGLAAQYGYKTIERTTKGL